MKNKKWQLAGRVRPATPPALFVLVVVIFLSVAAVGGATENKESVGMIVALRGEVTATDTGGATRTLTVKSPLFQDDLLRTGKSSRVQILFADNAIISLGDETVCRIAEFAWDPEKDKAVMTTQIKEGVFRVMGGLIAKKNPEKVITRTPSADIGIRGSMYAGKVSGQELFVAFEGGVGINIMNASGTVAITTAGYGTRVSAWQEPIANPVKLTAPALRDLRHEIGRKSDNRLAPAQKTAGSKVSLPVSFSRSELAMPAAEGGASPETGESGEKGAEDGEEGTVKEKKGQDKETEAERRLQEEITAAVKDNPDTAAQVLREAVGRGEIKVGKGLEAALLGMQKIDRQSFEKLVNEAIGMGLNIKETKEIAERIKAQGGGCQ